jgi:hypothetical protein
MDAQHITVGQVNGMMRRDWAGHIHAVDRIFMILDEAQARVIQVKAGQCCGCHFLQPEQPAAPGKIEKRFH